jgi:hypothetical protein
MRSVWQQERFRQTQWVNRKIEAHGLFHDRGLPSQFETRGGAKKSVRAGQK